MTYKSHRNSGIWFIARTTVSLCINCQFDGWLLSIKIVWQVIYTWISRAKVTTISPQLAELWGYTQRVSRMSECVLFCGRPLPRNLCTQFCALCAHQKAHTGGPFFTFLLTEHYHNQLPNVAHSYVTGCCATRCGIRYIIILQCTWVQVSRWARECATDVDLALWAAARYQTVLHLTQ